MMNARRLRLRSGLTLLETMILLVVMSIVSLGVGSGLRNSRIPDGIDDRMVIHTKLVEKLEELSALSFTALTDGTNRSDTVVISGQTINRTVTVALADADGNGATNSDFVQVTVAINGYTLATRVCQP